MDFVGLRLVWWSCVCGESVEDKFRVEESMFLSSLSFILTRINEKRIEIIGKNFILLSPLFFSLSLLFWIARGLVMQISRWILFFFEIV